MNIYCIPDEYMHYFNILDDIPNCDPIDTEKCQAIYARR